MTHSDDNALGNYLKDRRAKLDPAQLGFSTTRRRTPGLRREEVAQRANVSATWYTWLEQGRGGTPSVEVLDGIAGALALSPAEREHLFLLAQHRPPQARYQPPEAITPHLQLILDSLEFSPTLVRTTTWDIVGWNRAALAVLANYAALSPENRNLLRLLFCDPHAKTKMHDWESHARFTVATLRADAARFADSQSVTAFINELKNSSAEFEAMWNQHDVGSYSEGTKHIHHATAGPITLEYSSFTVPDRPDLSLIIFAPSTPADTDRVKSLVTDGH